MDSSQLGEAIRWVGHNWMDLLLLIGIGGDTWLTMNQTRHGIGVKGTTSILIQEDGCSTGRMTDHCKKLVVFIMCIIICQLDINTFSLKQMCPISNLCIQLDDVVQQPVVFISILGTVLLWFFFFFFWCSPFCRWNCNPDGAFLEMASLIIKR